MLKTNLRKAVGFTVLTFAITWTCWWTIAVANGHGHLSYGTPLSMVLFIVGGNAPPIAAYLQQKRWGETGGIRDFLKRSFNIKAGMDNYVLAAALLTLHFAVPLMLGAYDRQAPLYYGLLMIPTNIVGGGLEEIGWRGLLQPLLEKCTGFVKANLIIAAVWSLWHLPLWYIADSFQSGISFAYFTVSVFGMTFLLGALRRMTGSVFLCILLHSSLNSFWGVLMLRQNHVTIVTAALEVAVGLYLIYGYRKMKTGEQYAKGY